MPIVRPRKRASPSSSSAPRSWPATWTVPLSGRSSPASVISSVDLPEPDGPDQADRLALPYFERNVLEDVDARCAAPEAQIDFSQLDRIVHLVSGGKCHARPRHLWTDCGDRPAGAPCRRPRRPRCVIWRRPAACPAAAATPLRIVALGDSLTAGSALAAARTPSRPSYRRRWRRAASPSRSTMPASRATPRPAAWRGSTGRVPDGTRAVLLALGANDMLRGGDPEEMRKALDEIIDAPQSPRHRGDAARHARRPQSRPRLPAALRRRVRRARGQARRRLSTASSARTSRASQGSTSPTACIRMPRGST